MTPNDLIAADTSLENMVSLCVPCQGALSQRVGIPPGELLLQPEALGADQEVTNGLKHSEKRPFMEGQQSVRAAARSERRAGLET